MVVIVPLAVADLPLVSLVVPSYNVERYVADAIESALAQTYRPLEIVVIDDGSTDGTAAVVEGYRDREEVRYIYQENRGLAGARNRGIAEANGAFIGLLDADDLWMPEKVATVVDYLAQHPEIGWATTDCYLMQDTEKTTDRYYGTFEPELFPTTAAEQLETIARRNFMSVAVTIRRELLDRFGGFDEGLRSSEDYDLWIRFMLGGVMVGRVPEPLGWYRLRADSLSADPAPQWDSHLTVLERHLPALVARGASPPARECYDIARRCAQRGDRSGAFRFLKLAARSSEATLPTRMRYLASGGRAIVGSRGATRSASASR